MRFREYNDLYSTTNVRKGIIRSKNLSDELDSATIILTQVEKLNIQSNDLVELLNESEQLEYWLVANYHRKNVSFNPIRYDYTVDLMSLTKMLESIILPNLTITNVGQNRSILTYISNIMSTYFYSEYGSFNISDELIALYKDTICPECVFNEPTLREYLDYLLGFKGCISKLEFIDGEFSLTFLDLNPKGTELNTDCILSMEQSQNAEQYITQLEHTLTDVIGQLPITEYHRLKSDDFLFNTESAKLILHHKPYDIKRLIVKNIPFQVLAYMKVTGNSNPIDHATIYFNSEHDDGYESDGLYRYISGVDVDITDYLAVEEVFQSLQTLPQGSFDEITEDIASRKWQNNTLRWSRGTRTIDNFHYYQTKTVVWTSSDETAIVYAIKSAIFMELDSILSSAGIINGSGKQVTYLKYDDSNSGIVLNYSWKDDWPNLIFEIQYVPYINSKIKLKQQHDTRHLVSAIDNSSNALSDISSFIQRSFEKNNQLGNDTLLFYARSDVGKLSYDEVYGLGQYYLDEDGDKYILSTLETETKANCILYKGILTKNYSNRNIHTLINRERRYYSLADNSQSVIRNEVVSREYSVHLSDSYDNRILMLVTPFNIARFISRYEENGSYSNVGGYISSFTIAEKNLIIHSAVFEDNVVYATRVGSKQNGGYEMELLKYTNSYGELSYIEVDFRVTSGNDLDLLLDCEQTPLGLTTLFDGRTSVATFDLLKDSREQLCLNVQNIIVNTPSNPVIVDEDNITKLLKSKWITIETDSIAYLANDHEKKLKFGLPFHELVGEEVEYPCKLRIKAEEDLCITIDNYNGEYLSLAEVVKVEKTPIFENVTYYVSAYNSSGDAVGYSGSIRYGSKSVLNINTVLDSATYTSDESEISTARIEIWFLGTWGPLDEMTLNLTFYGAYKVEMFPESPDVDMIEGVDIFTRYCSLDGTTIVADHAIKVSCMRVYVDYSYVRKYGGKIIFNGPRWCMRNIS